MSDYYPSPEELLKPDMMLRLYSEGAFPMADSSSGLINWYFPNIRCIIPLDNFNLPRSLKKFMTSDPFEYFVDRDFTSVVEGCADRESTWISPRLISAYHELWDLGYIHTVEVYKTISLVGGLYGIAIGGAFFGESMFSTQPQASKCALVKLIEILTRNNFSLLDVQYVTEHLKMFGAEEISLHQYRRLLHKAYLSSPLFSA